MTKKKWALLILCILVLLGYFKFFYKTYSEHNVAKSADCIIALDVKRVTNTVIWNIITTPSQWRSVSFSSSAGISWKDMVKIPDYLFIFHSIDHPLNAWYAVMEIKNNEDFDKGLLHYHFEERPNPGGQKEYFSNELGIEMIRNGNKLLLGNKAVEDKHFIRQVADELFIKKQYITKASLQKNIQAASHLSIQVTKNHLVQQDIVIKLNFDKKRIIADAMLVPGKEFSFDQYNFQYPDTSLCTVGFSQPAKSVYDLVPVSSRSRISTAINFNIDSLMQPNNRYYSLDIEGFHSRVDSAISYTYDDNFNPVEKVVVNNVTEPAFNFRAVGDGASSVYHYLNDSGKLEKTPTGDLFTPMPFVRSYCRINENELSVSSINYKPPTTGRSISCIFFLNILISKIPQSLQNYFPSTLVKLIANMGSVELVVQKKDGQINAHAVFNKKQNDLPIIDL